MGKHKQLEHVAKQLEHNFLSSMNYVEGDYTLRRLYEIAQVSGVESLSIDIMKATISQEVFRTKEILDSIKIFKKILSSLLDAEHLSLSDIESSVIDVRIDVERSLRSKNPAFPYIECKVDITEKEGTHYTERVKETVKW
jgi:hypothetical protein